MKIQDAAIRGALPALDLVRHTEQEMKRFAAELIRVIAPAMGGRRAREIAEQAAQDMVPGACLWAAHPAGTDRRRQPAFRARVRQQHERARRKRAVPWLRAGHWRDGGTEGRRKRRIKSVLLC